MWSARWTKGGDEVLAGATSAPKKAGMLLQSARVPVRRIALATRRRVRSATLRPIITTIGSVNMATVRKAGRTRIKRAGNVVALEPRGLNRV